MTLQRTVRTLALALIVLAAARCGDDATGPGVNKVLSLDGTGDYMSVALANHTFTRFTVEAWIKVPNYTSNVHYVSLYQNVYVVLGDYDTKVLSSWAAGLTPIDAASPATQPTITADAWHHIAISYDGTNQYILIDGQVVATVPTTGTLTNDAVTYNQGLDIGARYTGGSQYVNGQMDEIRIWNVYRTPAQIQAAMNSVLPDQSGLVGYWNFDAGTANDLTAYGANGTLNGNASIVDK